MELVLLLPGSFDVIAELLKWDELIKLMLVSSLLGQQSYIVNITAIS
ncbi:hypothetical protein [Bacillus sp. OV322]|nr:hypothetical protein [Bacillus sp. OV322]